MDEQHDPLDPSFVDPLTGFICRVIKHHFFNFDGDRPIPEEEIRQAVVDGGGYIRMVKDRNFYLVITHCNGNLFVHEGRVRGAVRAAAGFDDQMDDIYYIDARRRVHLGLDGISFLVNTHPDGDGVPAVDVIVLDLKPINIQYFLEGLKEAQALTPST